MDPVTIFRFSPTEGPGYFSTFLDRHGIDWRVIALDAGDPVPQSLDGIRGIGVMGGAMSVNDDLPWVEPIGALLRKAVAADMPVIGHCLGGQMLAKALGVAVTRSPNVEIGWHEVAIESVPVAREWFGDLDRFQTFEWHNESFALPPGATRVLTNPACPNQGYVIGRSIGLQCHIEMTREMIELWVHEGVGDLDCNGRPNGYVQSAARITGNLELDLASLNRVADKIYGHWIAGLAA